MSVTPTPTRPRPIFLFQDHLEAITRQTNKHKPMWNSGNSNSPNPTPDVKPQQKSPLCTNSTSTSEKLQLRQPLQSTHPRIYHQEYLHISNLHKTITVATTHIWTFSRTSNACIDTTDAQWAGVTFQDHTQQDSITNDHHYFQDHQTNTRISWQDHISSINIFHSKYSTYTFLYHTPDEDRN